MLFKYRPDTPALRSVAFVRSLPYEHSILLSLVTWSTSDKLQFVADSLTGLNREPTTN